MLDRRWLRLLLLLLLHMGGLANSPRQGEIRLLVRLHKSLQRIPILLRRRFAEIVKRRGHWMVRTPDARTGNPRLLSQSHHRTAPGIPPRTLDRREIEAEPVLRLEGTANVEMRVAAAVVTRHARPVVRLADLAHLPVPVGRDEPKPFRGLQCGGLSELDLGRPDGTHHMDPVIAHRALQGLPGPDGLGHGLLPLPVQLDRFLHHLLLQPFFLAVPVRLPLVRDLGRFHQFVFRPRHGTQDTFVAGRDHRTAVVRTHVT